jgi:beta-1,2-mannobiose phosphorylase / 1,2-beta-oligomannan phosphorylase
MSEIADATPRQPVRFSRRELLATGAVAAAGVTGLGFQFYREILLDIAMGIGIIAPRDYLPYSTEAVAGWHKFSGNPVLGGKLGTCFDACILLEDGRFRMWFSWRPKKSIGYAESSDGVHWTPPQIVLAPSPETGWQDQVNRPVVLRRADGYHMWFTGQTATKSSIGYVRSRDGQEWTSHRSEPLLGVDQPWEKSAVMSPSVLWDAAGDRYRMWYSGGDQDEPYAIGYAESRDGVGWRKPGMKPVLTAQGGGAWDSDRVAGCQVLRWQGWYLMFFIGFRNLSSAEIGMARSRDGVTNWTRFPLNPIIRPALQDSRWDYDAVYRPWAIRTKRGWMLWYNGRRGGLEQIGLALHPGDNIWPAAAR